MRSVYSDNHRKLQDHIDSRALANTLEAATLRPVIDDAANAFIEAWAAFFHSTVTETRHPTVSHKGGAPGFIRGPRPDHDRVPQPRRERHVPLDGQHLPRQSARAPLHRLQHPAPGRAHANAVIVSDSPLLYSYPGTDLVLRATITETFINCPRYITKQASSEPASHVPDENGEARLAEWKKVALLEDVLPERFQRLADAEGGTLTADE